MESKELILQLIYDYMKAVYIDRDIEKASKFLTEDIICCDMNKNEFLISKDEVIKNLHLKEENSYQNCSLQIKDQVIRFYDRTAVFMGKIVVVRQTISEEPVMELRYSASMVQQVEWKIFASHYSMEQQNETLDLMEKNISGGILSCYLEEESLPLRYVNENLTKLLGYTKEEFWEKYGDNVLKIIYKEDFDIVFAEFTRCAKEGIDWRFFHRVEKKDGSLVYMLVRGRKSTDANGREIVTNFSIDVTDLYILQKNNAMQAEELEAQNEELYAQTSQLAAQQEALEMQNQDLAEQTKKLLLSEKKFRIALSQSKNIIFEYDILTAQIVRFDLRYSKDDKIILLTNIITELIEGEHIWEDDHESFQKMFVDIKCGVQYVERNIRTISASKNIKWYKIIMTADCDSRGNPKHAIGVVEDITKQVVAETDLRYQAEYDSLTQVYNKRSTMEKVEEKLVTQEGIHRGIFMMLDVDRFKGINDTFGHPVGDTILKEVTKVLKNNFRETDIIGRLGGDEFCVFVIGTKNLSLIRQKAEMIHEEIRRIFIGDTKNVSVSIGLTTCRGIQKNFEQIYKEADDALYHAKKKGRDTYCFYEECGINR